MRTIKILKGLPASGKSTYAKSLVEENPDKYKRVNRDSLRLMFNQEKDNKFEKFLLRVRDNIILECISNGYDVIVDDLNLSPKHEARIKSLVGKKAEVEVVDFFLSVPLETLIERNASREDKVPEKVIRNLYRQFVDDTTSKEEKAKSWRNITKKFPKPKDPALPDCIIVDIDGTLALMKDRSPYEWNRVGEDSPNWPVVDLVNFIAHEDKEISIFIVSGRDGSCEKETLSWLDKNLFHYDGLFMRPAGDMRKDAIIKEEIYRENIQGNYNVWFVLDDRNQTVKGWRELDLPCFQVAEGNF